MKFQLGFTHDEDFQAFSVNTTASEGLKMFAEDADVSGILREMTNAGGDHILDTFTAAVISRGRGKTHAIAFVDDSHHKVRNN